MMEEVQLNPVNTPRVRSRAEAWIAWEAAMKAKYSKIRKKIQVGKDKELAEFQEKLENEWYKLWMFVHNTRPRRKEVQVETLEGEMVWMDILAAMRKDAAVLWKVHPSFEFYRARQDYGLQSDDIYRYKGRGSHSQTKEHDYLFREDFHDFELTPEELEKRRSEEEAAYQRYMTEQLEIQRKREEQVRREEFDHHRRQDEIARRHSEFWFSAWSDLERPISHEALLSSQPMLRIFYLLVNYPKINMTCFDILSASIQSADRGLTEIRARELACRILGYADADSAYDAIVDGFIPNCTQQ